MPRVLCAVLMTLLFFTATLARAQTGALCIFSDNAGNSCNLTDTAPGFIDGDFACSCGIIVVEESTWGHIKSLYASPTDNP